MRRLIIFGVTDAAELARFHFNATGTHSVAAFCVDGAYIKESTFLGLPVVAAEDVATAFPPADHDAFVAVGYSRLNRLRAVKCVSMRAAGYRLTNCISDQAIVAPDVIYGENCFVMEGCIIQTGVRLGENVTIWSGGMIAHHSTIGNNVFLAPRVAIAGRSTIGDNCFLGINSTVRNHIQIGDDCVLSAGAVALEDLPNGSILGVAPGATRTVDAARFK